MEKLRYITEDERLKCQRVADAFAELYEMENIVVLDVGRYGFVKLSYYHTPDGFEDMVTYTDSKKLFDDLWQEWLDTTLYLMAKGTSTLENGYKGVFDSLTGEEKQKLLDKKIYFISVSGMESEDILEILS